MLIIEKQVQDDKNCDSNSDCNCNLDRRYRSLALDLTCLTINYDIVELILELKVCDPDRSNNELKGNFRISRIESEL